MAFLDLGSALSLINGGLGLYNSIVGGSQRKRDYRRKQRGMRAEANYIDRVSKINAAKYLKEGQYQSTIKNIEAQQLQEQAKVGYDFQMFEANRQRRAEQKILSQTRASYGASGVRVDSGSAARVQEVDAYISDYNYQQNQYYANQLKQRKLKEAAVARFEGDQARRIARDRARSERDVSRLKKRKLRSDASFLDSQIDYVGTQTGINVANDLFDLGKAYDKSRVASGEKQVFGLAGA